MSSINKIKRLCLMSLAMGLISCGGDSDDNQAPHYNFVPTHNGDIERTYKESDDVVHIDLLEGAIDLDGDDIRVRSLNTTASEEELVGITNRTTHITVDPKAMAPFIDSGQTRVIEYTYRVSDDKESFPRRLIIKVEGYDEAPVFEDIFVTKVVSETDTITVDLAADITDADGEEIKLKNIVADENNPETGAKIEGNILTIENVKAFTDDVSGGAKVKFIYRYTVADHNHDLPREATITLKGDPGPNAKTFSTETDPFVLELFNHPSFADMDKSTLLLEEGSITPVDDAPAFTFEGTDYISGELLVEPIAFYAVAEAREKTFVYSYKVRTGDNTTVEAAFELSVSKGVQNTLIENGGFEADLEGWTQDIPEASSVESTSAYGLDFSGEKLLSFSGKGEVTRTLSGLKEGALYLLEARVYNSNAWNSGPYARIYTQGGAERNVIASTSMFRHDAGSRTHALVFEGAADLYLSISAADIVELDDVIITRIGFEQANNLVGEEDSTFENGVGNWLLGAGASVSNENAISGTQSLHSGTGDNVRHVLPLGVGALKDGHRYLALVDVHYDDFPGAKKFRLSVVDTTDASNETTATGSAYTGVFDHDRAEQTFAAVIDLVRDEPGRKEGWENIDQALHLGTNVWSVEGNNAQNVRIDNVRLFEIQ